MEMRTIALVVVLASAGTALAGSAERPWRPGFAAARSYALHRRGVIAFAVRTPTRTWGWRVSLSILTYQDGSHLYGTQTLQGIAARLLRGLARAGDVR